MHPGTYRMLLLQTGHMCLLYRKRTAAKKAGSGGVLTVGEQQLQDVCGAVSCASIFTPRLGGQGYGARERQLLAQ